jgi:DNA-binding GntR family transcriptional regulator
MYRYRLEHIKDDDRRSHLVEEHDALVKAIEKGDVEEATEIISGHINSQQTVIVNHVNDERIK